MFKKALRTVPAYVGVAAEDYSADVAADKLVTESPKPKRKRPRPSIADSVAPPAPKAKPPSTAARRCPFPNFKLANPSNHCFFNSALQLLRIMPECRDYLKLSPSLLERVLPGRFKPDSHVWLLKELGKLYEQEGHDGRSPLSVESIRAQECVPQVFRRGQNDPAELIGVIADAANELSTALIEANAMGDCPPSLASAQYSRRMQNNCQKCGALTNVAVEYEPFVRLPVDAATTDLEECLELHFPAGGTEEVVEDYGCERCWEKANEGVPNVRPKEYPKTGAVHKVQLDFTNTKQLFIYVNVFYLDGGVGGRAVRHRNLVIRQRGDYLTFRGKRWELTGTIQHLGDVTNKGHYWTLAKAPASNQWWKLEDAKPPARHNLDDNLATYLVLAYRLVEDEPVEPAQATSLREPIPALAAVESTTSVQSTLPQQAVELPGTLELVAESPIPPSPVDDDSDVYVTAPTSAEQSDAYVTAPSGPESDERNLVGDELEIDADYDDMFVDEIDIGEVLADITQPSGPRIDTVTRMMGEPGHEYARIQRIIEGRLKTYHIPKPTTSSTWCGDAIADWVEIAEACFDEQEWLQDNSIFMHMALTAARSEVDGCAVVHPLYTQYRNDAQMAGALSLEGNTFGAQSRPELLSIPLKYREFHWTLGIYRRSEHTVYFYDTEYRELHDVTRTQLQDVVKEFYPEDDLPRVEPVPFQHYNKQDDGHSCGPLLCIMWESFVQRQSPVTLVDPIDPRCERSRLLSNLIGAFATDDSVYTPLHPTGVEYLPYEEYLRGLPYRAEIIEVDTSETAPDSKATAFDWTGRQWTRH